jgi:Icc-related predicted phosphoesterase
MINITFISDLHNLHCKWLRNMRSRETLHDYDNTDILVFCGDMSNRGHTVEIKDFIDWFKDQPGKYKVLIAGNHDFFFENKDEISIREIMPSNVIYLNDSGAEIMGLNFWGSPVTPWFHNWAFNRQRNTEKGYYKGDISGGIKPHWEKIPLNTDVLVTHGPPYKILDYLHPMYRKPDEDWNKGCEDLLLKVQEVEPVVHAFGHIHEGYGILEGNGKTIFVNASSLNENYEPVNPPITLSIKGKGQM